MVREFASEKRSDTYAPATGCHTLALIPLIYFKMLGDEPDGSDGSYKATLAHWTSRTFLQVPQDKIIGAELYNTQYLVLRTYQSSRCLLLALWKLRV